MNDNITDVVTTQDTIIRMQSKVISKLFLQLLQYTSAEEYKLITGEDYEA